MDKLDDFGKAGLRVPSLPAEEVDVSLIHWMLSLRPLERLLVLQNHIKALEALRATRARG